MILQPSQTQITENYDDSENGSYFRYDDDGHTIKWKCIFQMLTKVDCTKVSILSWDIIWLSQYLKKL